MRTIFLELKHLRGFNGFAGKVRVRQKETGGKVLFQNESNEIFLELKRF